MRFGLAVCDQSSDILCQVLSRSVVSFFRQHPEKAAIFASQRSKCETWYCVGSTRAMQGKGVTRGGTCMREDCVQL